MFANLPIPTDPLIDAAPVIIVPAGQCSLLDYTILHDYYFQWEDRLNGALPLGLFNFPLWFEPQEYRGVGCTP